jgi:hypothetical protein
VRAASFIRAIMEAICISETSLHLNMTIQRYIPVDSKLHTLQLETLKSLIGITFENSKKTQYISITKLSRLMLRENNCCILWNYTELMYTICG